VRNTGYCEKRIKLGSGKDVLKRTPGEKANHSGRPTGAPNEGASMKKIENEVRGEGLQKLGAAERHRAARRIE